MKSFLFTFLIITALCSFIAPVAHAQRVIDQFPNGSGSGHSSGGGVSGGGTSNSACSGISDFPGLVGCFTSLINLTVPLIIGIALFFFLWGLIKYVTAGGDDKTVSEARKFMLFGIIALFVMVSVWGLVGILVNTFFSGGVVVPQLK